LNGEGAGGFQLQTILIQIGGESIKNNDILSLFKINISGALDLSLLPENSHFTYGRRGFNGVSRHKKGSNEYMGNENEGHFMDAKLEVDRT